MVSSDTNKERGEAKTFQTTCEAPPEKPRQPKLWKFPVRDPTSKKTKSFHASWYQQFPWLEYDVEKDAAFCYCCSKFSSNTTASFAALTFTQTGYTNWANALDRSKGFQQHERSELHRNSYASWMEREKIRKGKQKDIVQRICPEREEVAHNNREYLRILFQYIIWFTKNEVPMRASDETDESTNPGKWLSFIKVQLETNPRFKELHDKFTSTRSMDYTSKTSVNDIIEVIAENIRHIIYSEIKNAGMFSTLVDESKDIGKREELALAVRYCAGKVVERFVDLRKLDQFDAHTIKKITKETIDHIIHTSGDSVVVCLGADGASVMSGEFSGVAELLRSENFHWLVYIHCTAHRLNLLVNDLIKDSNLALDIMSTIKSLYTFLNYPKVRE